MPSMPRMMSFCPPRQCALSRWHEGNKAIEANANEQATSQTIFLRCLLLHTNGRARTATGASTRMLAGSRLFRQTVSRRDQRSG
jgi:hypothetical protein